jgi:addiction module RelE/StbE family toxin
MMVRWTTPAKQDLAAIVRYIRKDKPIAAQRFGTKIREQVATLSSLPLRNHKGEVEGTRELIFHPWPYIAIYRIAENEIQIIRIRHAAQDWP